MKALKRIFAIVISLAMVMSCAFSSVVFAAEMNDVTDDNPYAKAINDLVAKGILTGYANEDGTYSFKSDGNITRAEFCAIVSRADAPAGYNFVSNKTSFTDVAVDHWASAYIEYAVVSGIVNGMGDGTFAPEAPVTYAQAVKMIVCALNYGFAAEVTDPWHKTYIDLANRLGVTKNAYGLPDAPAIRGLVAQLTYNMNNTAPAVQVGVDENGKPKYEMGNQTFEEETKGTQQVTGQVVSVFKDTLAGDTVANNQIKLKVNSEYYLYRVGSYKISDLKDFLGYEVDISYLEDDSGANVIERITKTNRNNEYVVEDIDIAKVDAAYIEYYDDNSKSNNGVTKLNFAGSMSIVVNGVHGGTISNIRDLINNRSGKVTFIDCDNDNSIDVAFVSSYDTIYVKSSVGNNGVYDVVNIFGNGTVQFDSNHDYVVKVANNGSDTLSNGTLSSIAKNNIVSYANAGLDDSEIIVSKKTVTGRVTDINEGNKTVKVGGKEYIFSTAYLNNRDAYNMGLNIDDNCTLYLDYTGKIVAVTKTETQVNYGYITNVAPKGSGVDNNEYVVKMYNSGFKTLSVATTGFKINGASAQPADLVTAVQDAASIVASGRTYDDAFNGSSASDKAILVKYELASNGQLKSVYTIAGSDLTFTAGGLKAYDSNKFTSAFNIDSATKVFFVPEVRTNDSKYKMGTGAGSFTNGESYYVDAFDVTNGTAKAVVVYGETLRIKPNADSIFVRKIDDELSGGNTVQKLKYDTFETLKTDEDDAKTILTEESDTLSGVDAGDIIKILVENGVVTDYMMIYDASAVALDVDNTGYDYSHHYYSTSLSKDPGRVVYITNASASEGNGYFATVGTVTTSPALTGTETSDATTMKINYDNGEGGTTVEYVNIVRDDMIYKYDSTGGTQGNNVNDYYFVKATRDYVTAGSKVLVISSYNAGGIKGIIVYP